MTHDGGDIRRYVDRTPKEWGENQVSTTWLVRFRKAVHQFPHNKILSWETIKLFLYTWTREISHVDERNWRKPRGDHAKRTILTTNYARTKIRTNEKKTGIVTKVKLIPPLPPNVANHEINERKDWINSICIGAQAPDNARSWVPNAHCPFHWGENHLFHTEKRGMRDKAGRIGWIAALPNRSATVAT